MSEPGEPSVPPPSTTPARERPRRRGDVQAWLPLEGPAPPAPPVAPESEPEPTVPARPPREACDVAVVGAGLAGLTVAALLVKGGASVVVLEQASDAGGVWRPYVSDGLRFDTGPMAFPVARDGALGALCARLGIAASGAPPDPVVQIALPGHRLALAADSAGWGAEVSRELAGEEAGWDRLWRELAEQAAQADAIASCLPPLPPEGLVPRLRAWSALAVAARRARAQLATPFRMVLERHLRTAKGQRVLEALLWAAALREAEECTAAAAARALVGFRGAAADWPAGPLIRALRRRVEAEGGEVRLKTEVVRLRMERGRAAGVETREGASLRARHVIVAAAPQVAQALLPPPRRWRRRLLDRAWAASHVAELLLVAVPAPYVPAELGTCCLIVPDAGRPARGENLILLHTAPSAPGESVRRMSVARYVTPARAGAVPGALEAALDQIVPGAVEVAEHRRALSSAEIERHWGRAGAAVRYAVDTREWLGRRGAPATTGVPRLWAIGDWTFPGRQPGDLAAGALRLAARVLAAL